ncbi:MAG: (2Fe-2S)-binding protein [Candidatus Heimdallarchaeota archaeon]|nr:(2Fe-2S)-binding protein [Candidatus Heimdallarchaeota archaeon]
MIVNESESLIINVNNIEHKISVKPNETLLDVLRLKLGIKSVKAACWSGDCGICTVLIDGKPMKSCLVLSHEIRNKSIMTVEGLLEDELFQKLQNSFVKNGAIQCGFCTSAFLLVGYYLIKNKRNLDLLSIKKGINGIICRCTGYKQIIDSIYELK